MYKTQKNHRFSVPRKLKFSRESQSISINTIIIAAIGLVVLIVLFVVFTGRFKVFSEGVKETGLTCKETCKLSGYLDGSKSTGTCDTYKLGGTFSDVDSQKEVCCCTAPTKTG